MMAITMALFRRALFYSIDVKFRVVFVEVKGGR
jgi:hypothetical protein